MNDNTEEYCRECQHPHVNERLRAENHKLKEMNTQDNTAPEAKHGKFYHEECGSQYEIKDDKYVWGQAYGLEAADRFVNALNTASEVAELRKENERQKAALKIAYDELTEDKSDILIAIKSALSGTKETPPDDTIPEDYYLK